jgi:cell wall-associated NlpC family hydrolase
MTPDTQLELALQVAFSHLGEWYTWGGDDPSGFDCSGFVVEVLKSCGKLDRKVDLNADLLYRMFSSKHSDVENGEEDALRPGMLVFWQKDGRMIHVEMVYAVVPGHGVYTVYTIGASGGGSATRTIDDAIKQNAFIKIRPLRSDWFIAADPF